MDAASIGQMISTIGFPITCVVVMFYMWNQEREAHREEMNKVTEALNNNTLALTKLEDYLKNGKN